MTDIVAEQIGSWDGTVLDQIWSEPMVLCYKALLFIAMSDLADTAGRASFDAVCDYFSRFYRDRRDGGRIEENPRRFPAGTLPSERSHDEWTRVIRAEPLRRVKNGLLLDENAEIAWDPSRWGTWSHGFRKAIRNTAETRLIEYFDKYVPGGY